MRYMETMLVELHHSILKARENAVAYVVLQGYPIKELVWIQPSTMELEYILAEVCKEGTQAEVTRNDWPEHNKNLCRITVIYSHLSYIIRTEWLDRGLKEKFDELTKKDQVCSDAGS